MDQAALKALLERVRLGEMPIEEALEKLKRLPFEDIGFACIDHHRSLRKGLSEVIYGEGKTPSEILAIMERMVAQG